MLPALPEAISCLRSVNPIIGAGADFADGPGQLEA